jgi:hypothetical protein
LGAASDSPKSRFVPMNDEARSRDCGLCLFRAVPQFACPFQRPAGWLSLGEKATWQLRTWV